MQPPTKNPMRRFSTDLYTNEIVHYKLFPSDCHTEKAGLAAAVSRESQEF